ncbi:MAG: glycosyltransferase family 39 protein, partial [Anaerolineales bacterium]|nr:glycosyltransferase family 39 protein [Anaerolineales bacterium]
MVSSNDKIISRDNPFSIHWEGYLWLGKTRSTAFTIPRGIRTRLLIDDNLVFHSNGYTLAQPVTFIHTLSPGPHSLRFELAQSDSNIGFFSAGLEWDTLFGQRLIPPHYLYPFKPDNATAQNELSRAHVRTTALLMALLGTLGLLAVSFMTRQHLLNKRQFWGLLFVATFALALRLIYLNDLVTNIPNFEALPIGSDHRTYEHAARNFVRGLWPPHNEFYRQPGFSWLLGNVHALFGPSIRPFQIMQLTTGALASMTIYAIGKRIFNPTTGWVAALLWATFPLAIFYDAQLVTHALEAQIIIWLMWLWLCAVKRPHTGQLIALGLLSGAAAVIRPAFLVLIPLAAISVSITSLPTWHQAVSRGLVFLAVAALPILPVTLHNYAHSGRFQLISSNGPVTLYLGNNRDAAGIGQYSQSFRATHERVNRGETTYVKATIADIQSAPRRWLGLMTRKTALYFGNIEIPNNVDFITEGTAISPLLAKTPLRFGIIVALGLTGMTL